MHKGNGLGQRSGTFLLKVIHLCGVSADRAVVSGYSRQLVGSCTINNIYPTNLQLAVYVKLYNKQLIPYQFAARYSRYGVSSQLCV